ncbi:CBS domain-containing protein [Paenibacillus kobensis]|uniref:CBS domain-containing protein n=1 Tax=Paenibacillus kobensis TaxID=59841 RepID=UPI000FDBE78A|nr:CBS domain-containing protein [Paenibacillus kobensis]
MPMPNSNLAGDAATMSTDRSERFETAVNKIHYKLKQFAGKEGAFVELLRELRPRYAVIRNYYEDLKAFARLRNAIVHEKWAPGRYIAEPHADVVERIELICNKMYHPPGVMDIATRKVVVFDAADPLENVMEEISVSRYSQFPVYRSGKFACLLTADGIIQWIYAQSRKPDWSISEARVEHIIEFETGRNYLFVSRQMNVFEIEDLFEEHLARGSKIEAVIVTENGDAADKPIGVVTPWDLIKINPPDSFLF